MKILQVFNRFLERGGQEVFVESLNKRLPPRHEVRECRFDSADWNRGGLFSKLRYSAQFFYNQESAGRLTRLHREMRPDFWLLHTVFPVGSPSVYHAAIKCRATTIQYCHDYRPFSVNSYLWANGKVQPAGLRKNFWPEIAAGAWRRSRIQTALYAGMLWFLHGMRWLDQIAHWIAVSNFQRERFIEAGIPPQRITALRHFYFPVEHGNVCGDGKGYLFLGRLTEQKGLEPLIAAWRLLTDQLGKGSPELFIAGDGPDENRFKTLSAGMDSIKWLGRITGEKKARYLRQCRAVIVPSISWETAGLTVFEAYDFCKPALVARSGGIPENVVDGVTGLIHEPGDAVMIAQHVQRIEKKPEEGIQMGIEGRKWLEREASFARWMGEFEKILMIAKNAGKEGREHAR